jgi:hypothetical protein
MRNGLSRLLLGCHCAPATDTHALALSAGEFVPEAVARGGVQAE